MFPRKPSGAGRIGGLVRPLAIGLVVLSVTTLTACTTVFGKTGASVGHSFRSSDDRLEPVDYSIDPTRWDDYRGTSPRSRDPRPLTELEVFGFRNASVAIKASPGRSRFRFTLQGTSLDSDCSAAVWGDRLKAALRSYDCTQVLRGVYADPTKLIVGYAAVFNLNAVTNSRKLLHDLDPAHHKGFLKPMSGLAIPLNRFGSGYTGAYAIARGHFVVLSWFGYTNGTKRNSDRNIYRLAPWSGDSNELLQSAFLDFLEGH
jgi:hypothetical protein